MTKHYHSNGKLLISGEYVVLDGALSLALPTKFGQSLRILATKGKYIRWTGISHQGKIWFEAEIDINSLHISNSTDEKTAKTLANILSAAKKLNPEFLSNTAGIEVTTTLDFPQDWGLGSSSTLINNIASWAEVDAFQLLFDSFSGSGYDIACAQSNGALTYQLHKNHPTVTPVDFKSGFSNSLFFVHLNKKQNSREGIARYRDHTNTRKKEQAIKNISGITEAMLKTKSLSDFEKLINQHEDIIASIIGLPKVKDLHFSDFNGSIKSLGAWGGDFILATGERAYIHSYFMGKGYNTILSYHEMIL
ncbi:GYDIA family GHMP kinase [Galbibacter sp. EGI 63066]|uniref:GYDIA family GHMP kinase n=1 Tax=Galbibacter sp. EGI 63066 TaxID=2993559 RepID=UPI002248B5F6|nr:GYDIA family GHMP kinase [Galbibacter sp. EGI 63066]MCX2679951.1 GYDIA family GHMP kinase [Galbibacter sp. EGI 63066]